MAIGAPGVIRVQWARLAVARKARASPSSSASVIGRQVKLVREGFGGV